MPSFDFISNQQFRESLESDYREMGICIEHGAWKSAQVTAGSMVEALLIDYIQAYPNAKRSMSKGSALQLDLAEAITIALNEGVISKTTSELCSVVRAYRNLIHPGRVVRTNEPPPGQGSATIAFQLVDVITNELSRELQKRVGLTAEQVLSKVERDPRSVRVLNHLLVRFDENQRRRLLLDVFPAAHARFQGGTEWDDPEAAARISEAHRIVFDGAEEATKRAFLSEFVRILKEEDGHRVETTSTAFFRGKDLAYVEVEQRALVLAHLLDISPKTHSAAATVRQLEGIERYLDAGQVNLWLDPLVRTLVARVPPPVITAVKDSIFNAAYIASEAFNIATMDRLTTWEKHFISNGQPDKAKQVADARDDDIPF